MTLEAYLRSKYTPSFSSTSISTYSTSNYAHGPRGGWDWDDYYENVAGGVGYGGPQGGVLSLPFEPGHKKNNDEEEIREAYRPDIEAEREGETLQKNFDPNTSDILQFQHDCYWREYKKKEKTSYLTIFKGLIGKDINILSNIKKKDVISIGPTEEYVLLNISHYDTKKSTSLYQIKNIHVPTEIHFLYQSEFFELLRTQHVPDAKNRDLGSEWNDC